MLDLKIYTLIQLILLIVGVLGWVVAYAMLIRNSFKFKFVEMPIVCVAFNMAWEFYLGSFAFPPEKIGYFLSYGYRYAILIDIGVVTAVLLYAKNQIEFPFVRKYFSIIFIAGLIVCFLLNYSFIQSGFDTKEGSVSGYLINLIISSVYISNYYHSTKKECYSLTLAVSRAIGGVGFTIFNTITYFDQIPFLAYIGFLVIVLDTIFITQVIVDRRKNIRKVETI